MINQRNEKFMFDLILNIAQKDDRIRAVIMNGSRASISAKKDIFQDYDIVYVVDDVESFVNDPLWIKQFGEVLIMQMPDEMDGIWPASKDSYAFLIQFKDWNRIDLTLRNIKKLAEMPSDSQSILLLDKDNIVKKFDPPSDKDYLPKPPTAKDFSYCCIEFFWVSTYLAKGIWRKELPYAKHVSEQCVKEELIKLLTWYAGIKSNYEHTIGKFGKYLENFLEPDLWDKFTQTYADANYDNMWKALFVMCDLFNEVALKISHYYGYQYNAQEYTGVIKYLHAVKQSAGEQ